MSNICEFFRGKNVLITGATGFCGKILVEKLIRSCAGIGKIFVIVRRKKNGKRRNLKIRSFESQSVPLSASPQERYLAYINHMVSEVFD